MSNAPGRSTLHLVLLAVGGLGVVLAPLALSAVGESLVVSDRLRPSDAIFVVDGAGTTRELEAASLYHRGFAPFVVVVNSGQASVVGNAGVPRSGILLMEDTGTNTRTELTADFKYAQVRGFRRIIFVTSASHTRRVRIIWNWHSNGVVDAIVHPTPFEPFGPDAWWRSRAESRRVLHEVGGIIAFVMLSVAGRG